MTEEAYPFSRSKEQLVMFLLFSAIFALFAWLNLRNNNLLVGRLFLVPAIICFAISFMRRVALVNTLERKLSLAYSIFGFRIKKNSVQIQPDYKLRLTTKQINHQGGSRGYSLWLDLDVLKSDSARGDQVLFFLSERTSDNQDVLLSIADFMSKKFGMDLRDER